MNNKKTVVHPNCNPLLCPEYNCEPSRCDVGHSYQTLKQFIGHVSTNHKFITPQQLKVYIDNRKDFESQVTDEYCPWPDCAGKPSHLQDCFNNIEDLKEHFSKEHPDADPVKYAYWSDGSRCRSLDFREEVRDHVCPWGGCTFKTRFDRFSDLKEHFGYMHPEANNAKYAPWLIPAGRKKRPLIEVIIGQYARFAKRASNPVKRKKSEKNTQNTKTKVSQDDTATSPPSEISPDRYLSPLPTIISRLDTKSVDVRPVPVFSTKHNNSNAKPVDKSIGNQTLSKKKRIPTRENIPVEHQVFETSITQEDPPFISTKRHKHKKQAINKADEVTSAQSTPTMTIPPVQESDEDFSSTITPQTSMSFDIVLKGFVRHWSWRKPTLSSSGKIVYDNSCLASTRYGKISPQDFFATFATWCKTFGISELGVDVDQVTLASFQKSLSDLYKEYSKIFNLKGEGSLELKSGCYNLTRKTFCKIDPSIGDDYISLKQIDLVQHWSTDEELRAILSTSVKSPCFSIKIED
jgi:hypothetical protein